MAYIGMRDPIAGVISSRVDGSAISYGTPFKIGPAVSANITFDIADNPDYGDDVIIDNDKGLNGYNITLETNDIRAEARAKVLGWKAIYNSATPPVLQYYEANGGVVPEVGLAFIRVKMFQGVRKFETFFFHALQFSDTQENASTKNKQITWNHPSMSGTGIGVYNDDSGDVKFFDWMEFDEDDFDDAVTWIYARFGTTPPSSGTGT